jgi:hypothetical protein
MARVESPAQTQATEFSRGIDASIPVFPHTFQVFKLSVYQTTLLATELTDVSGYTE